MGVRTPSHMNAWIMYKSYQLSANSAENASLKCLYGVRYSLQYTQTLHPGTFGNFPARSQTDSAHLSCESSTYPASLGWGPSRGGFAALLLPWPFSSPL